jgi:hypothetical protein
MKKLLIAVCLFNGAAVFGAASSESFFDEDLGAAISAVGPGFVQQVSPQDVAEKFDIIVNLLNDPSNASKSIFENVADTISIARDLARAGYLAEALQVINGADLHDNNGSVAVPEYPVHEQKLNLMLSNALKGRDPIYNRPLSFYIR